VRLGRQNETVSARTKAPLPWILFGRFLLSGQLLSGAGASLEPSGQFDPFRRQDSTRQAIILTAFSLPTILSRALLRAAFIHATICHAPVRFSGHLLPSSRLSPISHVPTSKAASGELAQASLIRRTSSARPTSQGSQAIPR
jgi:hypothetical protein